MEGYYSLRLSHSDSRTKPGPFQYPPSTLGTRPATVTADGGYVLHSDTGRHHPPQHALWSRFVSLVRVCPLPLSCHSLSGGAGLRLSSTLSHWTSGRHFLSAGLRIAAGRRLSCSCHRRFSPHVSSSARSRSLAHLLSRAAICSSQSSTVLSAHGSPSCAARWRAPVRKATELSAFSLLTHVGAGLGGRGAVACKFHRGIPAAGSA